MTKKEEKKTNGTPMDDEKLEQVSGGGRMTCFTEQPKSTGNDGIKTSTNMRVQGENVRP